MAPALRARLILQTYIIGIPLWWILGVDFIALQIAALALICFAPAAHRSFSLSDQVLLAIILVLGASAYLNGLLVAQEFVRFIAALYNLSLWVCGFVVVQQVRYVLRHDEYGRRALLATAVGTFALLVVCAFVAFVGAYATGQLYQSVPTLFGLALGDVVPGSAPLVERSTEAVFTRPDWGLAGTPMPRVSVFGPYPTSTGGIALVLGALSLLYVISIRRAGPSMVLAMEGLIIVTVTLTLTRSIVGGWLMGYLIANIVFGSSLRRLSAAGAGAVALLLATQLDVSGAVTYRQYSSESRFDNYVYAGLQTLQASPVLGIGIKPREEDKHIAVGSHSTFVSSFTKGGTLGLSLVIIYFVLLPVGRWIPLAAGLGGHAASHRRTRRAELRVLLNAQIALLFWLGFEDVDAPATACMLVFFCLGLIEAELGPGKAARPERAARPSVPPRPLQHAA